MLTKKQVLEMIESLLDTFLAEPFIDKIILLQTFTQGEEVIKTGKGLSTAEVKKRLEKWLQTYNVILETLIKESKKT